MIRWVNVCPTGALGVKGENDSQEVFDIVMREGFMIKARINFLGVNRWFNLNLPLNC